MAIRPSSSSSSSEDKGALDGEKNHVEVHFGSPLDAIPDPDAGLSDEERAANEKKLLRKLDWNLIPWLTLLYLLAFLDRTNIGNAKIDGLLDGTNMTPSQYNITLTLFWIPYALFEPLTNVLLKRFRPSIFIPAIMVLWGIVMTTMGLVHNFAGLATTRWFLGMMEAGLFPGVNYYLSCWYRRDELGFRAAIFFSGAAIAGSFGGLLAAGIAQMRGVGGKPGWAWIFILEGLVTVVVGVISYWMVHDFPTDAKFLTEDERARVLRRLALDQQASSSRAEHKFQYAYLWAALKDWKTYAFALIYMGADMPLYCFSLFLPTIIAGLGISKSSTTNNLLSVPPYVLAAILTVVVGWYADRSKRRGLCVAALSTLGITGFAMLLGSNDLKVKYAGTFLAALGIYPNIPNIVTWTANNTEGVYKRGIVLGIVIGWGNLNGIVSSNVYLAKEKAIGYPTGHSVVIGELSLFLCIGSLLAHFALQMENRKRLAGKRDYLVEGKSEQEIAMLGDKRPDFIYVT